MVEIELCKESRSPQARVVSVLVSSISTYQVTMALGPYTRWLFISLDILLSLRGSNATQLFSEETAPADISQACLSALTADVACSRAVPRFRYGYFYSESSLSASCTSECEDGLKAYETAVVSACADDTWEGYDDEGDAPVSYIPSLLRYQYSLTCLRDSGRWCNVVTGAAATVGDAGGESVFPPCSFIRSFSKWSCVDLGCSCGNTDSPFRFTDIVANGTALEACDMCFVLSLKIQAGAPFYDGPAISSQSLYESKTSSCKIDGMPITATSVPFPV